MSTQELSNLAIVCDAYGFDGIVVERGVGQLQGTWFFEISADGWVSSRAIHEAVLKSTYVPNVALDLLFVAAARELGTKPRHYIKPTNLMELLGIELGASLPKRPS